MATDPSYAATVKVGAVGVPATADTNFGKPATNPSNTATVVSGGTNGTKIEQIRITQTATTSAAGYLNLFLCDGTDYHLIDGYAYAALTLSTTVQLTPVDLFYANLVVPTGWSLRCTVTTTAGQSAFSVAAFGGDF